MSEADADAAPTLRDKFLDRTRGFTPIRTEKLITRPRGGRPPLWLRNRVGVVAGAQAAASLWRAADTVALTPETVVDGTDWGALDALVICAGILPMHEPWRRALLGLRDEAPLLAFLVADARSHGVPVVLWLAEEPGAEGMFAHLFSHADLIVAPPGLAVDDTRPVLRQGPHVDARVFNPIAPAFDEARARMPLFSFLLDGYHEIGMKTSPAEMMDWLGPLLDYNWWAFDGSVDIRNNDNKHSAAMRRRFMGTLKGGDLAHPLRLAQALVLHSSLTEARPHYARRRCLEAGACKTAVLTDDAALATLPFIRHADGPDAIGRAVEWLLTDEVGANALQHLAWRHVMSECTTLDAVAAILARLGVAPDWSEPPDAKVNVVVPTIRPELIPFLLDTVDAQIHPDVALSIVVNGVEVPPEYRRLVEAHPTATLHSMPNDKSIGYCINYGVDQVEAPFWAKFDDDDIYGPHYLSDLLLQRKYARFDITGKAAFFNWFEGGDRMHTRRMDLRDTYIQTVGGGTLVVRQGAEWFPEDVRGYADTLFLYNAQDRGKAILSGDPFNFIQVRRSDVKSHTWTAGAHQLNLNGPRRPGLDFMGAII
ncbi:hypothetical protein E2L08_05430 [Palleronia sediminis]|uniref:Glycosyl transferase family 2 n=1 Tax=Palleronia sediminis TaxID=2547833 RepID=A0A4R6AC59_9RHOB|nr:hypothetical protein [Palleronia sediminis]TDL81561.1 hypothetical protein E2L08_05430 [Palleronia sediminis]